MTLIISPVPIRMPPTVRLTAKIASTTQSLASDGRQAVLSGASATGSMTRVMPVNSERNGIGKNLTRAIVYLLSIRDMTNVHSSDPLVRDGSNSHLVSSK